MPEGGPRPRADRLLGLAGAAGGLLWAAVPVAAAVAFFGIGSGSVGLGGLAALGGLFRFAGLSVVGMLAGSVGLYRAFRGSDDRLGRRGATVAVLGFVLLLPGSVVPSGRLPADLAAAVPLAFFAGLALVAAGSLAVGLAGRRSGLLPGGLAGGFGAAMPVGGALGGAAALAGAGNLVFVLGLMAPYGLAWAALGGYLAQTG